MNRSANHALAALIAYALTLSSVSAIIAVPLAQAARHAAIGTVELA